MKKYWIVVIAVIVVVFLAVVMFPPQETSPAVVFLTNPPVTVSVEVADSFQERQVGLMFRTSLEGGMLFIFEESKILGFWMKNTLIPLDMIFINEDLEIVTIHQAVPCEADPCPTYYSDQDALYVVEVNRGFAEENSIQAGDRIEIRGT